MQEERCVMFENGLLSQQMYWQLPETHEYRELQRYAREFLVRHPLIPEHYRWVRDPFHQWSRRWEYPFVYHAISTHFQKQGDKHRRVIDAGSGITFFPYFLTQRWTDCEVLCCDSDPSLIGLFDTTTEQEGIAGRIRFRQADLRRLPCRDASIDVAYCISVLEHTHTYGEIVAEFSRVLRPGGLLVLTYDVGLDGVSRMSPATADNLMAMLDRYFETNHVNAIQRKVLAADVLTSTEIGQTLPDVLPWRFPWLSLLKSAIAARQIPTTLTKRLTCYCGAFTRRK